MPNIVVSEFVSLDGVMQDPGGAEKATFPQGGWTMPFWNDEIAQIKFAELRASDALLLGRVTYQGFAAAWPNAEGTGEFGERMNGLPKFVVSTTLETVEWQNSRLIPNQAVAAITALKEQSGTEISHDILVAGSATLVQTLLRHGLVDVLRLLVYPVVLGTGKRLFGAEHLANLELITARSLPLGVALLEYRVPTKE